MSKKYTCPICGAKVNDKLMAKMYHAMIHKSPSGKFPSIFGGKR